MFRLVEKFDFHPISLSVPLSDGLSWTGGGGWTYEEKIDGWRAAILNRKCFFRSRQNDFQVPASLNNCQLDGEFAGGVFHAFDLMTLHGQDLRGEPLSFRKATLADLLNSLPSSSKIVPVKCGQGGEFLESVLARGGEGVVAKHLDSTYGEPESWVKCKRIETHDCIVSEIHQSKKSARLCLDGQDAGWCGIPAAKMQALEVGLCVEVSCMKRHTSGKLREPRFIRLRPDK